MALRQAEQNDIDALAWAYKRGLDHARVGRCVTPHASFYAARHDRRKEATRSTLKAARTELERTDQRPEITAVLEKAIRAAYLAGFELGAEKIKL